MARSYTTAPTTQSAGRKYGKNTNVPAQEPQKENKVGEFFNKHWKLILIIVLVLAIVSSGIFAFIKWREHTEDVTITRTWDEIKDVADALEETADSGDGDVAEPNVERGQMQSSDPMAREINWASLLEINPQIECWVYIPETTIDYPVLRPDKWSDNQYYLNHDVYGKSSSAGSVYMPAAIEGYEDRDIHKIIIGHNMRNGSMFSSLLKYKEKSFWEVTPYIYLYYPDRVEKWQIYSPYHTTQADEVYNMPYEAGTVIYQSLLQKIENSKLYDTATNGPSVNEPLLTLTTCDRLSTADSDGRFIVNAKLTKTVVLKNPVVVPSRDSSEANNMGDGNNASAIMDDTSSSEDELWVEDEDPQNATE